MKITIFFFSGTGNTWYVANSLADSLNEKGAHAKAISIEKIGLDDAHKLIADCDKVVLGYPIYGSTAPKNMRKFINKLPDADGKPISVLTTVALYSGDGTILFRKLLKSKGYTFETGMEFIMPNNLNIPGFPDVLPVGDKEKINRKNRKAKAKAEKMAEAIVSSKTVLNYDRVFGHMMGAVQRKYVDDYIKKMSSTMYTEMDKCIKCMRCVKMCPVENIAFGDNKIIFGGKCIGCMRCYHFCPTGAINITEKSLDAEKWPRYKGPDKGYVKTLL